MISFKYKNDNFTEREGGTAFSLVALFPYVTTLFATLLCLIISKDYAQKPFYVYAMYLANQIALITVLLYVCKGKKEPLKLFSLNKCKPRYYILAITLTLGMLFGLGYLNELLVQLLDKIGLNYNGLSLPLGTPIQIILSVVIVGLLPPLVEELVFRGVILSSISRFSQGGIILLSGLLFSLFHQNPAQTIYQFITGVIFTFIVLKSGSILPSIIMHAFNNVFIILINAFFPNVNLYNVYTVIIGLIVFILSLMVMIFTDNKESAKKSQQKAKSKEFFLTAFIGIAFAVAMWIVALF